MLTRDRELLKLRGITHGCYVHALKPAQQFREIARPARSGTQRAALHPVPGLQCAAAPVDKARVLERLPPSVRANYERFTACDSCGRVFWEGSHWRRMQALLSESAGAESEPSQSE